MNKISFIEYGQKFDHLISVGFVVNVGIVSAGAVVKVSANVSVFFILAISVGTQWTMSMLVCIVYVGSTVSHCRSALDGRWPGERVARAAAGQGACGQGTGKASEPL